MSPTINPTGYCPRCQQITLLRRQDIDTCLAIILLIFTAGIGLIIYLIWYYSKEENTCVHCGTKVTAYQTSFQYTQQPQPQLQSTQYSTPTDANVQSRGDQAKFCSLCGERLEIGVKFCPNCGAQI